MLFGFVFGTAIGIQTPSLTTIIGTFCTWVFLDALIQKACHSSYARYATSGFTVYFLTLVFSDGLSLASVM